MSLRLKKISRCPGAFIAHFRCRVPRPDSAPISGRGARHSSLPLRLRLFEESALRKFPRSMLRPVPAHDVREIYAQSGIFPRDLTPATTATAKRAAFGFSLPG